jgi:hypothetical protein
MPAISEIQTCTNEIVITERVVTDQFVVKSIIESVEHLFVRVELEVGPFEQVTVLGLDGQPELRLRGSRRNILVWSNADYLAVRDTWDNASLIAAIPAALSSGS